MKCVLEFGSHIVPCLLDPTGVMQGYLDEWGLTDRLFPGRVDSNSAPMSFNHQYQTQVPVDVSPYSPPPEPKLNTVYIPTGAQRFSMGVVAIAHEDATAFLEMYEDAQADHTVVLVLNDTDGVPEDIGDAVADIRIPLIPVNVLKIFAWNPDSDEQQAYIISLVDTRYFLASLGWLGSGAATTWEEVFTKCGLNGPESSTAVAAYKYPNYYLFSRHIPLMLAADAVAESVGMRVINQYEPTAGESPLIAISPTDATVIFNENLLTMNVISGSFSMPLPWANNMTLYCPVRTKRIPSKNLTEGTTDAIIGFHADNPGTVLKPVDGNPTFHTERRMPVMSTFYKDDNPDNTADCQALVDELASDYWQWNSLVFDFCLPGLQRWKPTGFEDFIIYDWRVTPEENRDTFSDEENPFENGEMPADNPFGDEPPPQAGTLF